MKNLAVAISARVSSDQQTQAQTIDSQVAALRARVTADDCVLLPECEFIAEGDRGGDVGAPRVRTLT
jgi:site-specific DNA recombinase